VLYRQSGCGAELGVGSWRVGKSAFVLRRYAFGVLRRALLRD
jgi:hypothetical protein